MNAKYSIARGISYGMRYHHSSNRPGLFDNFFKNVILMTGAGLALELFVYFIHWFIVCNWYTGFGWY